MSKQNVKETTKKATKKQEEEIAPTESLPRPVRPGLKAYVSAIQQLLFGWIKKNRLKTVGIAALLLITFGGLFILVRPGQGALSHDEIVIRVNKEVSIQGDGNPVILTVEDKLKATQPFLQQAENGDKVLLYYKAKKAILYRPAEKRIVHQGAYTPPDAKVFIRNGSSRTAPLDAVKKKLEAVPDITLASEDSSQKTDYKGISIVHVTDRYDEKVQELASSLNAQVVRLPAGESFPDADILIIVGS